MMYEIAAELNRRKCVWNCYVITLLRDDIAIPILRYPVAVLGKNMRGTGPSSFGRQQWLSEITIEPIKNWGAWARFGGSVSPWPQHRTATGGRESFLTIYASRKMIC